MTARFETWRDGCAHNPECASEADCAKLDAQLVARPVPDFVTRAVAQLATAAPRFPAHYLALLVELARTCHLVADNLSEPAGEGPLGTERRRLALLERARAVALEEAIRRLGGEVSRG